MVVDFDLGTLNNPSARIHSPRKAELARRFYLHLAKEIPRLAGTTAAGTATGTASGGGTVVADPDGPRLLQAKATTVGTVVLTFQARKGGDSGIHLHGTAGCIGGWSNATGKPGPLVGYRCCDTSPFFLRRLASDSNGGGGGWVRHAANATTVLGSTVTLHLPPASAAGATAVSVVRYAWESYPNCGLYSGGGAAGENSSGPVAGGPSVYGGIAAGCQRKPLPGESWTGVPPDCVYQGKALPALPFEVELH